MERQLVAVRDEVSPGHGGEWLLVVQELAALSGLDEERLRMELSPFFEGHEGPFSIERLRSVMLSYLESIGPSVAEPIVGKH